MYCHMHLLYSSLISEPFDRLGFCMYIYSYRRILADSGMLASPGQHNLLADVSQIPNVRKVAMLARERNNYKLWTIKPH